MLFTLRKRKQRLENALQNFIDLVLAFTCVVESFTITKEKNAYVHLLITLFYLTFILVFH